MDSGGSWSNSYVTSPISSASSPPTPPDNDVYIAMHVLLVVIYAALSGVSLFSLVRRLRFGIRVATYKNTWQV